MTNKPLPDGAKYVVIGAGMHGMSTAWHLAMALEKSGKGKGSDVVLLDKTGPGAGATGVACGCVRNFYMTGPLHTILRHSVDVWQSDPANFGFQQVGYVSVGEDIRRRITKRYTRAKTRPVMRPIFMLAAKRNLI